MTLPAPEAAREMPECEAFAKDIRSAFGDDHTRVAFGTRLAYACENGREWGRKGEEGVRVS